MTQVMNFTAQHQNPFKIIDRPVSQCYSAPMKPDKRQQILAVALDLFAEFGFSHVSVNMIAKQAGVGKSLIFHHFTSKEQLWDEVKGAYFSAYASAQINLFEQEKDPIELIRKSMRYYFEYIKSNPQVARFFAYAHLEGDEKCGQMDQELIRRGGELIRQAQENGQMRKGFNPAVLVMSFLTTINQYFVAQCHFAQWDPNLYQEPEQFISELIELTIQGVMP